MQNGKRREDKQIKASSNCRELLLWIFTQDCTVSVFPLLPVCFIFHSIVPLKEMLQNQTKGLNDLLRWSIEHSDPNELAKQAQAVEQGRSSQPFVRVFLIAVDVFVCFIVVFLFLLRFTKDPKWLDAILGESDLDAMRRLLSFTMDPTRPETERFNVLSNLESYVEVIDNANGTCHRSVRLLFRLSFSIALFLMQSPAL